MLFQIEIVGDYDLKSLVACASSFVSILGTFLSFFLVVAFMFLLIFAYNTKKKSRYVGNGIDVKNIQYISKPFSSGVNPYSKKSKEIPVTPPPKQQHTPLEVNTIQLQRGTMRSSFFMG